MGVLGGSHGSKTKTESAKFKQKMVIPCLRLTLLHFIKKQVQWGSLLRFTSQGQCGPQLSTASHTDPISQLGADRGRGRCSPSVEAVHRTVFHTLVILLSCLVQAPSSQSSFLGFSAMWSEAFLVAKPSTPFTVTETKHLGEHDSL